MIESIIPVIKELKKWRSAIHCFGSGVEPTSTKDETLPREALDWYSALLALPVSKTSALGDTLWDFNADEPHAARNVQGAKLRIDFNQFEAVNQLALLEVKVALFCYLKTPASLRVHLSSGRVVKANTAISCFKAGLAFINTMSKQARSHLTDRFFDDGFHGLAYFDKSMYREAALVHPYMLSPDLLKFFRIIRSNFFKEEVFGLSLPHVELESLSWLKNFKASDESERVCRILPNVIFEKASREASFAVVDFLDAIGEEVQDLDSLSRRDAKQYFLADENGMSREKLNFYTILRLRRKGYDTRSIECVLDSISPEYYSDRVVGEIWSASHLQELHDVGDCFRQYLNFVSYSACYLVAQYTGMRPSELSEILVCSCLEPENNYWLIVSNIIKHRKNLSKIFDDKWIAIPIVRDAIRVAHFVAKVKQSPYLFSNVDTVRQGGTPRSMQSSGICYQFTSFLMEILTDEEYESFEFSPYSLRHTLAYQMARAELGLPFISYQLKHFGNLIGASGQNTSFSEETLGYGAIADLLSKGGRSTGRAPRDLAEREYIENFCDPDGSFAGPNAEMHKVKMRRIFAGYMAAGYTKDQIFAQMVQMRLALINVGQGFCYGGNREEFDESLPCIGSLRCNPARCKNAVVTKANAPKWREVHIQNYIALNSAPSSNQEEIRAAMDEAKIVLEYLGEEVDV
ncbi:tyrosine-type recombinase/integrase [Pseudomonas sp.]|uniref:tyrosine-type recombinase/integrase n=1 Tax=Pseudomonas sp. TaxID=306 RepID=UPI00398226DE